MSEPLTAEERAVLREWAQTGFGGHAVPVTKARIYLRYEATLQAKDEQIEQLVAALRAYMVWEPATVVEADYRTVMYRAAEAAIKEATTWSGK